MTIDPQARILDLMSLLKNGARMAGRTGFGVDRGSVTWSTFPKGKYKAIDMTCKAQTSWGQSPKTRRIHLGKGRVWVIFKKGRDWMVERDLLSTECVAP
jgi:hypothetical protein